MFSKKCKRCARKIKKDFEFCPYCGLDFRGERRIKKEQDFGLLGREDSLFGRELPNVNMNLPFGFNGLFNSLLKEVDKQFREIDKEIVNDQERVEKTRRLSNSNGISISISTGTGKQPEIKVETFGKEFDKMKKEKEVKIENKITEEQARKISKLPKKEAETQVRRLSNKIIYEISLPGINNLKDVVINKLENSVEIKAFSEKTAYFKLLPINLPILNYSLKDSKLIIEFRSS